MKKILLPLFLGALGISAQAQINNGGFEVWNKVLLFEHPFTGQTTMSSNYETFFDNGELNATRAESNGNTSLRIENINGSENIMPGYFIFGKTPQDGLNFGGGFQIFEQDMIGLAMDLKYNMPDNSEGFVIVQFKNGDELVGDGNYGIGTYFFPITGNSNGSNVEFSFDYSIDASANTCVIAIASADVINSDIPFIVEGFVEVDNIEFIGSEQIVPGGDFESWTQVEPLSVPANCYVDLDPINANYSKSIDEYEGSFALKLTSTLQDENIDVGYALMGNKDEVGEIIPTAELNSSGILSFRYFYLGSADMGEAKMVFYKETNDGFEAVHEHVVMLTPNENYQLISYDFASVFQENEINATHVAIEFKSSIDTKAVPAKDGTVLLLDDVALMNALSINSTLSPSAVTSTINSYPNPTNGRVVFNFGMVTGGSYRVYNQSGALVATRKFVNKSEVIFDLLPYPAGLYMFRFNHLGGKESVRVIRE